MAYDEEIERTIESLFPADAGLTSKRMFGGVCYLYQGNNGNSYPGSNS